MFKFLLFVSCAFLLQVESRSFSHGSQLLGDYLLKKESVDIPAGILEMKIVAYIGVTIFIIMNCSNLYLKNYFFRPRVSPKSLECLFTIIRKILES